jgi:hypothetical protein
MEASFAQVVPQHWHMPFSVPVPVSRSLASPQPNCRSVPQSRRSDEEEGEIAFGNSICRAYFGPLERALG